MKLSGAVEQLYETLNSEESAQVCRDVPESACQHQPRNFVLHLVTLALTKSGDALADPKLVLAWLLSGIGAPAALIGLIVPIRESLAMLPQLVISAIIRRQPVRKTVYVLGCVLQGLAMLGMGAVTLLLSGAAAGWAAVGLITVFGLARSLSSISFKDVIGKTVSKGQRGTVSGSAGTVASAIGLGVALGFAFGWLPLTVTWVSGMVLVAGLMWLFAGLCAGNLIEEPGATEGGINGLKAVLAQLALLKTDVQLRRFIVTRILLLSTALAPPFYVALSGSFETRALGALGAFMLASAMAGFLSTYIWGRLADLSSRKVLIIAALVAMLANGAAAIVAITRPDVAALAWVLPGLLFLLMIAHQGVRLGRSTHVVDMADRDSRATYTALSNSTVGLALLFGGGFGLIAQALGITSVLALFAVMALLAAFSAAMLDEVQA
ncbi:MAG: hypothetical protein AB8C46_06095 [Burkholderiaceae bacterium]